MHNLKIDENPLFGIILCTGKKQEQMKLLDLKNSDIHIAEYMTVLPSKAVLEQQLHLRDGKGEIFNRYRQKY